MTKTLGINQAHIKKPVLSKRRYIRTSLSERERASAYARYRSGDRIQNIIADLGLTIAVSQFLWIFPPDPVGGSCTRCRGSLSRLKEGRRGPPQAAFCTQCGHCDVPEVYCPCAGCSREKLIQYERELVRQAQGENNKLASAYARYWSAELAARSPNKWSTKSLLWLGARMVFKQSDDQLIPPGLESDFRAATLRDGVQVPERGLSAFYFDENGRLEEQYISRVPLVLGRGIESIDAGQVISLIRAKLYEDRSELQSLWLDITTSECIQFAIYCLQESPLAGVQIPHALSLAIRDHLIRCSARQIYYALFIAARATSANLGPRKYNQRVHAMNTFTKFFYTQVERVEKESGLGWGIGRPTGVPRSFLSRYFFHHVLDVAEDAQFSQNVTRWLAGGEVIHEYKQEPQISCPDCRASDATLNINGDAIVLICRACGLDRLYLVQHPSHA
jgi:hypothetical protein